jgi:hypothetical protein
MSGGHRWLNAELAHFRAVVGSTQDEALVEKTLRATLPMLLKDDYTGSKVFKWSCKNGWIALANVVKCNVNLFYAVPSVAFAAALKRSHLDVCEWLLQKFPHLKDSLITANIMCPAIRSGKMAIVRWTVDTFENVNVLNALKESCRIGFLEAMQFLASRTQLTSEMVANLFEEECQASADRTTLQWLVNHCPIPVYMPRGTLDGAVLRLLFDIDNVMTCMIACLRKNCIDTAWWIKDTFELTRKVECVLDRLPTYFHTICISGNLDGVAWFAANFGITSAEVVSDKNAAFVSSYRLGHRHVAAWLAKNYPEVLEHARKNTKLQFTSLDVASHSDLMKEAAQESSPVMNTDCVMTPTPLCI